MFSKRNHLLYHFSITIHLHLASFYAQNTFKKIARKMLIEQIIEFKLRVLGPLAVHVLLQLVKFMKGNSLGGLLFTVKRLQKAMCLTSPYMNQITYN